MHWPSPLSRPAMDREHFACASLCAQYSKSGDLVHDFCWHEVVSGAIRHFLMFLKVNGARVSQAGCSPEVYVEFGRYGDLGVYSPVA